MPETLPITLVVITKNEEKNLARCLKAADFCREILVVDSGSTDKSLNIATEFGARILHRDWTGYRDQKNYGADQAAQEWVLCIDADEVVSPDLREAILNEFHTKPTCDGFELNRHAIYAGKTINHCGWYPQWRLFLYRKGKARWSGGEPHTVVDFRGSCTQRLRGDLYHFTYDSIRQHFAKNIISAHDSAVDMFKSDRKATVADLLFRGPWAFSRTYFLQLGFLDGFYGFIIAFASGTFTFIKYAMLAEMHRQARRQYDRENS
jgi:glycosyltransferase involved in cell wall biosynthesis